jgi:hypothetical protein
MFIHTVKRLVSAVIQLLDVQTALHPAWRLLRADHRLGKKANNSLNRVDKEGRGLFVVWALW